MGHPAMQPIASWADRQDSRSDIEELNISSLRRDGATQCRALLDEYTIAEYQAQMESGAEFPPIRVWFDGQDHWLADGFQRVAAAEKAGRSRIFAEIRTGSLSDAKWDSYRCNSTHGLPRTKADAQTAVVRALEHPNAAPLSNVQLAKYLGIPEPTLRRWRKGLSSPNDEDMVRVAVRKGKSYRMRTRAIGQNGMRASKTKSLIDLEHGLAEMKEIASPEVRSLLNVFGNWAFGTSLSHECLNAIERIVRRSRGPQEGDQKGRNT
jgi:hypothetical protein